MTTHLSQPTGIGAFDGQHGMSVAIASEAVADMESEDADMDSSDMDMSSVIIAASEAIAISEAAPAITGRDNGASASPAIMTIASSRRMVIWRFTHPQSHSCVQIESRLGLTTP